MARSSLRRLLLTGAIWAVCAAPAAAQFGTIFGDPPPRPPGSVPGGPPGQVPFPQQQFPQQQFPQQRQQPVPPPAQTSLPQQRPPGIQSEPLAPPPGATAAPPIQQQPQQQLPPAAGLAPQLRRGTPVPADTSPQPGDEVISEPPAVKIVNRKAAFAGLDKITGRIIAFDADIGETVQFGALQVTPRACYTRPPTENQNTDGFVEVEEVTLQGDVRRIFAGWMFAASPGLHAVEHPIYDVWLTDCKAPVVSASAPPPEPPPQAAAPPATRPPPTPRPRAQAPAPAAPRPAPPAAPRP